MSKSTTDPPAWDPSPRTRRAAALFAQRFGAAATHAAAAPGRVNLIGDHTDYNDGFVLPMAIDRRAVVLARPREKPPSRLWAADLDASSPNEVHVDLRRPDPEAIAGFAAYLVGAAAAMARDGATPPNLDLMLTSSVPRGAGLASSAAITVAMATLLEELTGITMDGLEKARRCQWAEHTFAGTPCGIMDQLVAVCGRRDHALLIDCRDCTSRPVPLPDAVTVLVADTGVRRELASSAYAERRATCRRAAQRLGLTALRGATADAVDRADLDEVERRCVRHVVSENRRTVEAADALAAGDVETAGRLMLQSHCSLRDDYEVSCPELDTIVESAEVLIGEGVLGARMAGGGFGGCAVILTRAGREAVVMERISQAFAATYGRSPSIFQVHASDGTNRGEESDRATRRPSD